jgi:hypothetical protein
MTIAAQTLVDVTATHLLNDTGKVRFRQAGLLAFLNEGQRAIASLVPSAYSATTIMVLVAGSVQALPANANLMLRPRYNVTNTTTPGSAVTPVKEEVLNATNPNWRTMTPVASVKHVMYNADTPAQFHVYPPATAGTRLAADLALIPADILIGDNILLDDTFEAPLRNYMLARCYEKDAEYAGNPERVAYYMGLMRDGLGLKGASEDAAPMEAEAN